MRKRFKTREEWLAGREDGIGASEAAAVVDVSPWMTSSELFEIKTGMKQAKDLSDSAEVSRGVRMEKPLRELFKAMYPDFTVEHHPYDILCQEERTWLFATLDGEVKDANGRLGILEIKTCEPAGKSAWQEWYEGVPSHYYAQILHQLLATGYSYVILFAALINRCGDAEIRKYVFERDSCQKDMDWLLEKEIEFWNSVQKKTIPPMTILF